MNAAMFRRVAWKEYRALRGLWIVLAALSAPFQLLTIASRTAFDGPQACKPDELYAIALLFTALFALGASVILFAVEREEGTSDFLLGLPADPRGLFFPKVVVALTGLLALAATLAVTTTVLIAVFGIMRQLEPDRLAALVSEFGLNPLEILAWGILFSMLSRRTVVAACLGTAAASITLHISVRMVGSDGLLMRDPAPYAAAVFPYRLPFLALAVGLDIWLGRRWLPALPLEDWLGAWRARRESTRVVDTTDAWREAPPKPLRRVMLRRLMWQAFRMARPTMAALLGVGALLTLLLTLMHDAPKDRTAWAAMLGGLVVTLCGACVFLADHQRERYCFFSERPVSAGWLWLSRELCWLAVLATSLVVATLCWIWAVPEQAETITAPLGPKIFGLPIVATASGTLGQMPAWMAFAVLMLLAFSIGQLCSMLLRSGILAAVTSVILFGLSFAWVTLLEAFGVNWLLSIAPPIVIAFFISWLRAWDWITDRNSPRAWTRVGISTAACIVTAVALMAVYRVKSVPKVEPGFSLASYSAQVTPEAMETAAIYRRAGELLVLSDTQRLSEIHDRINKIVNQRRADGASADVTAADAELAAAHDEERAVWRDIVEQNQPALKLFIEASARPHCAPDPSNGDFDPPLHRAAAGENLLLKEAQVLTDAGDLDEALSRIIAALRMHSHLQEHCVIPPRRNTEPEAMRLLLEWSVASGQTAERIRSAITALADWEQALPPPDEQLMALYEYAAGVLEGKPEPLDGNGWSEWLHNANIRGPQAIALRWFPWERARALRVLNLLTEADLRRSKMFFGASGKSMALDRAYLEWESDHGVEAWMRSTMLLRSISMEMLINNRDWRSRITTELRSRSTQIQLALVGWQMEHGELPASLDALVGPWFAQLPRDPNTGGEFRYLAKGADVELSTWDEDGQHTVAPGTPLLWSPGSMLTPNSNPTTAERQPYCVIFANRQDLPPQYGDPLDKNESLRHGVIMPIPRPK